MKISTKTFALAVLLAGGVAPSAFAAVPDPVTINITYENGSITKTNANGNLGSEWTANDTDTQFKLDVGVNNITVQTSGNLQIAPGKYPPCVFSFSMTENWYVSAYSFKATATTGNMSISHNGKTSNVSASESATVSETLALGTAPSIELNGDNSPITFNDFTVTLSYRDPADPALTVDEAPAAENYGSMAVTNIVGDHFNTFTTWYHLLDGKNFLTAATLTDAGSGAENAYGDEYLYCVVKSGDSYALYNKAAGTATPVSGVVLTSENLTANGKEVTARFAQKFVPIAVTGGSFTRTDGTVNTNAWQGTWTSTAEPVVKFFGGNNNMSTTDSSNALVATGDFRIETGSNNAAGDFTWTFGAAGSNYIFDYSFLATKNGTYTENTTITPNGGAAVTLGEHARRVTGSGYSDSRAASFVQNGLNLKGAVMTDVYVTVRRLLINFCEREGYPVFPDSPDAIQRIPALACVPVGEHAGRLVAIYDRRHNRCGDIGSGNISLQISMSDDNGKTWTEPDLCRDAEGNPAASFPANCAWSEANKTKFQDDPNTYWNVAFGDAAIVADRETGRLLMMAVGGPTNFFAGRYDKPNQCARWTSEDGGETWSPAQRMTYKILDLFNGEPLYGKIDSQFIGSGRMMQSRYVKVGDYYRVYAVLSSQNDGGNTRNFVLYTDDFGENWKVLGGTDVCPVTVGNGDECKTEELPDGSVLLAGRSRWGNRNFNIFRYTDATKGEGTWLTPVNTNMGFGSINACDGEIMVLPAKDNTTNEPCYLVLQSFPFGGGRNYVSIAYKSLKSGRDFQSPECFTTWEGRYRVDDGASVYSTMIWQNDNTLGFLYEDYRPNLIGAYLNFTIEEITDGKYSYQVDEQNRTAIELTKSLLEIRSHDADFTSKYVGQPVRDEKLFDNAIDAYFEKPSYNGYMKINKLEYGGGNDVISVVNNGGYRLTNAHNGKYNIEGDRYLSTDGTTLTASSDENNIFKVIEAEGGYKLFNTAQNVYAANTPSAVNTPVPVTANAEEAGVYEIVSNIKGESHFKCVNPGAESYPALHMASSQAIVIWTAGEQASQWYMELIDAPEGYEPPVASEPEYDDYDFDYENNAPVGEQVGIIEVANRPESDVYYDLQGRRVAKPSHGIYITTDGRKRLF